MNPCQDEAIAFHGSVDMFYMIGDCKETGNVREAMRYSFAAASQV